MDDEEDDKMNQDNPMELQYRSLFENDHIQNFLRRHGLATDGQVPLRKEEIENRLRQIDDQNALDLITQSVIEKALDIKRPFKKSIEHNPYIAIYDNACAITMLYYGSKTSRSNTHYTFKIQGDEVIVMQYQTNAGSTIVYKSYLTPNDEFTFKSHRLLDKPFTIAIYINGVIDSRISTCCEQGYLKQRGLLSKRSLFQLLFVSGGNPCYTCQANELMDLTISDNEEAESEWLSTTISLQSSPRTTSRISEPVVESNFTKKHKTKSGSKSSIISALSQKKSANPSNSISMETEALPEAIEKQLTAREPPQSKANEMQTTEKMITNEENEKHLKNETKKEDKLVNQTNGMINKTDQASSKQNTNDPVLMKISNEEEEEEGHGLMPSVANHEMQQLLSKYLLLLLPQPKSQVNNNDTDPVIMTTSVSNNQESANVIQQLVLPLLPRSQREIDSKMASCNTSELTAQRENVESFVLIWLDVTINKNEDTIISQTKLRAIVNSLLTFHTIDETIIFIENIKEEKVFLIISGSLAWELIERPEMTELSQLDSIYVFCRDESKHKSLMERDYKVRGIFIDIDPLCNRLKEDLQQTSNDLLPISVAPGAFNKDKSISNKQKQEKQVTFLCAQLHRELLFTMEYSDDARLELVEFCIKSYLDNDTEREFIEELRNEYHMGKAVWWYTRPTFLYKMLNTALFRQDIPMLYKFHFFIKDLHMQLEQLHNLYKPSLESRTFTVYRGLGMPMKIFDETIRQEVHNLLAFDTFLSTSLNKDIALQFAKNKSNGDDESILLEIEIDTDKLQRPFADISHLSEISREDEILFSIGTVFRIDYVADKKTKDGLWIVHLSSIDENDKQLKNETKQTHLTLLNFFKRVCQAQIKRNDQRHIAISYVNMASIYYKQGKYQKSLDLYQKALEKLNESSLSNPLTIATYQSNIARVYMALERQDEALKLYEKALKIRIELCEPNDPLLINTLHTIGHIYRENKDFDKALEHYHRSLEFQPISLEPPLKHNPSSIAATHINIALVHHQQNMTNKALDHFLKALGYQREYLSEYHPILAFLYNNIGAMYYRLKKYDLALKNQLLTLQIEERSLPKEHKTLAVTYTNIATSYEQLERYDQAIDYAQKAINQLKFHSTEDNSDLQTKQVYLDRLLVDKEIFQDK